MTAMIVQSQFRMQRGPSLHPGLVRSLSQHVITDAPSRAQALLGSDQVVGILGVLAEIDLQPVHVAGEGVVARPNRR